MRLQDRKMFRENRNDDNRPPNLPANPFRMNSNTNPNYNNSSRQPDRRTANFQFRNNPNFRSTTQDRTEENKGINYIQPWHKDTEHDQYLGYQTSQHTEDTWCGYDEENTGKSADQQEYTTDINWVQTE